MMRKHFVFPNNDTCVNDWMIKSLILKLLNHYSTRFKAHFVENPVKSTFVTVLIIILTLYTGNGGQSSYYQHPVL